MLACNAILAALHARERGDATGSAGLGGPGGRSQKVEVSLFETALHMLVNVASNVLVAGAGGGRYGNGHPSIVPYTSYRARDAVIALGVGTDAQFTKCAAVLGHPEWAADPRFAANRDRVAHRAVIDAAIAEAFAQDDADCWIAKLQAEGVPCGRINSVAEAFGDDQAHARAMIETISHPTAGARHGAPVAAVPGRAHRGNSFRRTRTRRGGDRGAARR